jgi:hypothetical protein
MQGIRALDNPLLQAIMRTLSGSPYHNILTNSPFPAQNQAMTVPTVPYANTLPPGLVLGGNSPAPANYNDTVSAEFVNHGYHLETLLSKLINGQSVTDAQAIDQYRRTGQHLGQFDTPDNAQAYARTLGN